MDLAVVGLVIGTTAMTVFAAQTRSRLDAS